VLFTPRRLQQQEQEAGESHSKSKLKKKKRKKSDACTDQAQEEKGDGVRWCINNICDDGIEYAMMWIVSDGEPDVEGCDVGGDEEGLPNEDGVKRRKSSGEAAFKRVDAEVWSKAVIDGLHDNSCKCGIYVNF